MEKHKLFLIFCLSKNKGNVEELIESNPTSTNSCRSIDMSKQTKLKYPVFLLNHFHFVPTIRACNIYPKVFK